MKKKQNAFKIVSILTSALYFYLFISLLIFPNESFSELGITGSNAFLFLVRRVSALMLGFSILVFLARNAKPSALRQVISTAVAVNMLGFAISSISGFIQNTVGTAYLFAAVIEIIITIIYLLFLVSDRRYLKKQQPVNK